MASAWRMRGIQGKLNHYSAFKPPIRILQQLWHPGVCPHKTVFGQAARRLAVPVDRVKGQIWQHNQYPGPYGSPGRSRQSHPLSDLQIGVHKPRPGQNRCIAIPQKWSQLGRGHPQHRTGAAASIALGQYCPRPHIPGEHRVINIMAGPTDPGPRDRFPSLAQEIGLVAAVVWSALLKEKGPRRLSSGSTIIAPLPMKPSGIGFARASPDRIVQDHSFIRSRSHWVNHAVA